MTTYLDMLPEELKLMIWKKVHRMYMQHIMMEVEIHHMFHSREGCRRCAGSGARCSDCSNRNWIPELEEWELV